MNSKKIYAAFCNFYLFNFLLYFIFISTFNLGNYKKVSEVPYMGQSLNDYLDLLHLQRCQNVVVYNFLLLLLLFHLKI